MKKKKNSLHVCDLFKDMAPLCFSLLQACAVAALGFCSVSQGLAQTSQPKINSEKHFPRGFKHNLV